MANLIGLLLVAYGSWLLWNAHCHRRACLAAPAVQEEEGPLTILAEVMPPLVMIGLGIAALEVILAYVMIGENSYFSLFDLLGVLYAIVAYGIWLNVKTRFRPGRRPDAGG